MLESVRAGYGWERHVIGQAIEAVIDEPAFELEHADALRRAVTSYKARSVDLHDCLLSAVANQHNTRVLSFDDDLRKLGTGEQP